MMLRSLAKSLFAATDFLMPPLVGPRILIYHQIGAGMGRQMEVDTDVFRDQMDWLGRNCEVVDLDSAWERRAEPESERLVVLTFDDGYEDVYRHGFPQLLDRGFPFTFYLTTNPVETQVPLTPDERAMPLTWDQIGEMVQSGLATVGAHTHTHADLRPVGRERVAEELDRSNSLIRNRVGVSPRHFAYPWGYWSRVAEPMVSERYQTAALASVMSINRDTDPLRLPRIPIQKSDGFRFFVSKLQSGMRAEERVRRLIKGYRSPRGRA